MWTTRCIMVALALNATIPVDGGKLSDQFTKEFNNGLRRVHSSLFHPNLRIENSDGPIIDDDTNCTDDGAKREASRKRFCSLFLHVDHKLYSFVGSDELEVLSLLATYVAGTNDIYGHVDFDGDGQPDGITLIIKGIKMESVGDPEQPSILDRRNISHVLADFSKGDYSQFCMAFHLTFQPFLRFAIGIVWGAKERAAGGVCEQNQSDNITSFNTGVITLADPGGRSLVSPAQGIITLAHEVGHALGSRHDQHYQVPECLPQENYLMGAKYKDSRNGRNLSSCTVKAIRASLPRKATGHNGCFTRSVCDSGIGSNFIIPSYACSALATLAIAVAYNNNF